MSVSTMIDGFGALAQPTRMAIFRTLRRASAVGMAAGDLSEALDVPPPTLSFHLKEMTAAGLLLSRRDGRRIIYSVNAPAVDLLINFLRDPSAEVMIENETANDLASMSARA